MTRQSVWFSLKGRCDFLLRHLPPFHPHTQSHALFLFLFLPNFPVFVQTQQAQLKRTVFVPEMSLEHKSRIRAGEWKMLNVSRQSTDSESCVVKDVWWSRCDLVSPFQRWETRVFDFFRSSGEVLIENGKEKMVQVFMLLMAFSSPAFNHTSFQGN